MPRIPVIFYLFVLCLCLYPLGDCIRAAGLSDAFFEAESCARALRKDSKAAKNPPAWTACIEKFQAVYRKEPKGPWAPASLYNSGMLYMDLARLSRSESDKKAAFDQFELLQKKFPDSGYRDRVSAELQKLSAPGPLKDDKPAKEPAARTAPVAKGKDAEKKEDPGKAGAPSSASTAAGQTYRKGEDCFRKLHSGQPSESTRREWMLCIGRFHSVYLEDPSGELAAASLFREGVLYQDLYKGLKFDSDQRAARENFEKIVKEYPQSQYAAKAGRELQGMAPRRVESAAVARRPAAALPEPEPPQAAAPETALEARRAPAPGEQGLAVVEDLRYWSNPNYTRVVVYLDRETDFVHHMLKKDPVIDKPPRLYVDLSNATMGDGKQKNIPINDDLLSYARAARNTLDSVRVVMDIKSFETYKVFSLRDPFRIVVDVWGGNGAARASAGPAAEPAEPAPDVFIDKTRKMPRGALAKQLALGVRRVVIDPGHGGKDFGAPGFFPGVHEKDVVLEIAKRVTRKLRENLGLEVVMTRSDDRYLTLEERTAFANTRNGDLFVSIHTNASRDPRAYGTETYFLNLATDDESIRVAAMENATSTKNISDLHSILNDLLKNAKINESSRLAAFVQATLVKNLNLKGYERIKDKGVKQAPFYVLLGARMPSILVETAFISNREECQRLTSPSYQENLADSIVMGIRTYMQQLSPTAFSEPPRGSPG
ncbi:MAG: N-acetylmuramoyl-L-alanine amidase [Deltaproteobacteria bacterium]|nr:N-acetylmuramoyl-L-alanine amidase [Deltaproteobacteria bacterium]